MTQRSKSTLFLIEQLIVIAVFAICAAACISILTAAFFNATDAQAAGNAILKAETAAELYKATGGDIYLIAEFLGGVVETVENSHPGAVHAAVYYNQAWQISNEATAVFVLRIYSTGTSYASHGIRLESGGITVGKITGELFVDFPLAARQTMGAAG
ncbi:MAG: type II secretion system GspH family protein [Oscillospiraceae bacterium]|nr:type II secretion system GspH family protein [Oscillospiraceae bacterium]